MALIDDGVTLQANPAGFERNPAEGATTTSPTQLGFFVLDSSRDVLFGDGLDGLGMKRQKFGRTRGEFVEFGGAEKMRSFADRAMRSFVAVVPNKIDGTSHATQRLVRGGIFDSIRKSSNRFHKDLTKRKEEREEEREEIIK